MFKIRPLEIIILENQEQLIEIQSTTDEVLQLSLFVTMKNVVIPQELLYQCQTSPQFFILSTTKLTIQPHQMGSFLLSFIPDLSKHFIYYISKIVLQTTQSTFQIPVLGVVGAPKLVQSQNSVINCGQFPADVSSNVSTITLQPNQSLNLFQDQIIYYFNSNINKAIGNFHVQTLFQNLKLRSKLADYNKPYVLEFKYKPPQAGSLIYDVGESSAEILENQKLHYNIVTTHENPVPQLPLSTITNQTYQTININNQNQNQSIDMLRQENEQRSKMQLLTQEAMSIQDQSNEPSGSCLPVTIFVSEQKCNQNDDFDRTLPQQTVVQDMNPLQAYRRKTMDIIENRQKQFQAEPLKDPIQSIVNAYMSGEQALIQTANELSTTNQQQSLNFQNGVLQPLQQFTQAQRVEPTQPEYTLNNNVDISQDQQICNQQQLVQLQQQQEEQQRQYNQQQQLLAQQVQYSNYDTTQDTVNQPTYLYQPILHQSQNDDITMKHLDSNLPLYNGKPINQLSQEEAMEAYYKEKAEIEELERQENINQVETYDDRIKIMPSLENCIYEHEQLPDMISVSVQYTNSLLYYYGNDDKYLFNNIVFNNKPNDYYYRLYNNQLLFTSTLKDPVRFEQIGGFNSATTIWYLTSQIVIENLANRTGFYQNIKQKYINQNKDIEEQLYELDDDIEHSIENLSYLCYQLQFVTQDQDIANYRLNIKSDKPLIGVIAPGEKTFINITFAIVVADVMDQKIPDLPRIFQNFVYDGEQDNMQDLSNNVFLRMFAVRFDRMYGQEELEVLPYFKYEDQFDNEIRDVVDIPVVFQNNIVVNKLPHKEIRAKQEFNPKGDFRLDNQNIETHNIKYLQALNLQYLKYMTLLPCIEFDSVLDFGTIKLKRAKKENRFEKELDRRKQIEEETKNFDETKLAMQFTPGGPKTKQTARGRSPKMLQTPKTEKPLMTAKANEIYIENDGNDEENCTWYKLSSPVQFKFKNVDFKKANMQKLLISLQPTNLPRLYGFEDMEVELPIISDVFHVKFADVGMQYVETQNCIVVDTAKIFASQHLNQGVVDIMFSIPELLNERIIDVLCRSGVGLPVSLDQQYELTVSTFQQKTDNCVISFPLLLQAKIDLHPSVAVNRSVAQVRKGVLVKNCILGTNLKTINGFTDQIFTDIAELDCGAVYSNSKAEKFLQFYNGSDRTIVVFCENVKKPFKAQRTFKIAPYSQYLWQIMFNPLEPGNYSQTVNVQWPDLEDMTKERIKEKTLTKESVLYKQFSIKLTGAGVPVCLLMKQLDQAVYLNYNQQNIHTLRVPSGTNQCAVQFTNISMKPVVFYAKTDECFSFIPAQGTIEPMKTGTVLCRHLGGAKQGQVKVQAEYFEGGQQRKQCVFDGMVRVI